MGGVMMQGIFSHHNFDFRGADFVLCAVGADGTY